MSTRLRRAGQAIAAGLGLVAGSLAASATAHAATPAPVPVVTIHVNSFGIRIGAGAPHRLHAGTIMFKAITAKGDHELQIFRLHSGYSPAQFETDLPRAFGGNVAAVRRVDSHVTFRGGAETHPNKPGWSAIRLFAGSYVFVDADASAHMVVTVFGTPPLRARVPRDGSIGAYSYGFVPTPDSLPANGWVRAFNQADQPHVVEFQHVKQSTTGADVRKFIASGVHGNPSWGLPGSQDSGVLSPNRDEVMHLNLQPGKYLVLCYWPDDDTGMPHFMMGMWKLIELT